MSEDTRTVMENEKLIQEMLAGVDKVTFPIDEPIVHKGDATLDAPMVAKEISSAGYVYVWDTETFEKLPVLYYMLPSKLRQIRKDGVRRFTTIDPKQKPWRGTTKCLLHKDGEQRKYYDTLGFRVCNKQNITNPHALTQHMRLKHPQEWKFIEEARLQKEKQEDRELQRAILSRVIPTVNNTANAVKDTAVADTASRLNDPVYLKRVEQMAKARKAKKEKQNTS